MKSSSSDRSGEQLSVFMEEFSRDKSIVHNQNNMYARSNYQLRALLLRLIIEKAYL